MMLKEREKDNEYIKKYYDPNMSLLNCGGLTLINKHFFPWAKKVMGAIRRAYDDDKMDRDPRHSFEKGKQLVMSDNILKSCFESLCQRHSPAYVKFSEKVYLIFLSKAIHARFAVVLRRWKEKNIKKHGQVAFRTGLKAQNGKRSDSTPESSDQKKKRKTSNKSNPKKSSTQSPSTVVTEKRNKRKRCAVAFSDDSTVNRKRRSVCILSRKTVRRVFKNLMYGSRDAFAFAR